jgi:hypothetical protein
MRVAAVLIALAAVLTAAAPAAGAPARSGSFAPFADLPPVVERTASRTVADVTFGGLRRPGVRLPPCRAPLPARTGRRPCSTASAGTSLPGGRSR